MTYTFKLSRRLAISNFHLMLTSLLLLCACTLADTTQPSTELARGGTKGRPSRPADTSLVKVTIAPSSATLMPAEKHIFIAKGVRKTGDTVEVSATWTATGGQIDSTGEYNASSIPGTYRVIGTHDASLADTSQVVISALEAPTEAPTLIAIVLTPASISLSAGATQQSTVSGQMSDSSTNPVNVTYSATGGTITSGGLYTAGQTAGTYRVLATQAGGTLADTAVVTITVPAPSPPPPPPPPASGTTFFNATAETGTESPWSMPSPGWGARFNGDHSATQTRVKNGSWAYKYEVTNSGTGTIAHDVRTMSGQPQTSMGSPHGRYLGGYYSWWMYIDSGYTTPAETTGWNLLMGWMTGTDGAPNPICNLGLEVRGGVLQLVFVLKNASSAGGTARYAPPAFAGMTNIGDAWYRPTVTVPFPRSEWVHVTAYTNFAKGNGVFKVWQNGTLIMDMTAPTMNLYDGWPNSGQTGNNLVGDMMLQFGNYGGHQDGTQRFYMDDFKVTDYRVVP